MNNQISSAVNAQRRLNQRGGEYENGKALPMHTRINIIDMFLDGYRKTNIAETLKVSNGCISKIIKRFSETGQVAPGASQNIQEEIIEHANQTIPTTRRRRIAFSQEQTLYLENVFATRKYINAAEKSQLSLDLNIPEKSIQTWFSNRRAKDKRTNVHTGQVEINAPPPEIAVPQQPVPNPSQWGYFQPEPSQMQQYAYVNPPDPQFYLNPVQYYPNYMNNQDYQNFYYQ